MDDFVKNLMLNEDDYKRFIEYQQLINGMDIAMWRSDLRTDVLTPFFGLEQLIGSIDTETLLKKGYWMNLWHPDDRLMIKDKINDAIKHNLKEISVINRIKHTDGHYLWIYTKTTIEYEENSAKSLLGISINIDKIHHMLQKLNVEKEKYQNVIKATRAATWVWDLTTGETIFDDRWAEMVGYTLDELKPVDIKTWEKLVHPDDLKESYNVIQEVIDKKTDYYVTEYRMRHKNGSYVWISDRGKIVSWCDDGRPKEMVGIHLDISKRKNLENDLYKSEKYYRFLIKSSYAIIYTLDAEGYITFVSDAWQRQLQYNINDSLKTSISTYIHPEDLSRLEEFFAHIRKTGEHVNIEEFRLRERDGQYRWYNTNASTMTDNEGKIIGYVGTARDITARKLLQDQLSLERDLFKKTLLSVGDAIISTDKFGQIVIMNRNAEKLLAYDENDAKGKLLWDVMKLYFEDSNTGIAHSLETMITTEEAIYINMATLFNQNGKQIQIELSVAPIQDAKRVHEGVVIIFRDISEKLRKQKEIEFLSYHDYLTGLYNRRYMDQVIQDLDKDRYLPLGIMILDVNDLKEMNDEFGHQAGDDLLKKISRIIENQIDSKDILGRIGGDEFLVLIPNTSEIVMYEIKYRLIHAFEKETLRGKQITVALGYAIKTDADADIYDVMKNADDFMYEDKEKRQ